MVFPTFDRSQPETQAPGADAWLAHSIDEAEAFEVPYRHFIAHRMLPPHLAEELALLPLPALDLDGVSGRRELHNDRRLYLAGDMLHRVRARRRRLLARAAHRHRGQAVHARLFAV